MSFSAAADSMQWKEIVPIKDSLLHIWTNKKANEAWLRKSLSLFSKGIASYLETLERAIVLFNRNLPTHCHNTSLRAFVSWIVGMALSMRLCAYSIGSPIGAGLISREKHYHPFHQSCCLFEYEWICCKLHFGMDGKGSWTIIDWKCQLMKTATDSMRLCMCKDLVYCCTAFMCFPWQNKDYAGQLTSCKSVTSLGSRRKAVIMQHWCV